MKMNLSIKFRDYSKTMTVDTPSECPHCGRTMSPQHVGESVSDNNSGEIKCRFSVIYRCSFEDCLKYFVIEYMGYSSNSAEQIKYFYRPPISINLPQNIEKISPLFVDIYAQATVAESEKLDHVAGVGYRKSAEFLIKDYLIEKNKDKEEDIKTKFLGKVIQEYLTDFPKLQALAKTVAWIGNDETHYTRRHNDKDIKDLKKFILATAQFIAADYDADEALEFVSSE